MGRIRTIKPEMALHEDLFDLEQELGLPVRFAWALLPTQCDRHGRFKYRPRRLKAALLPHDDLDFSRVLHAWVTRGFIRVYRVGDEWIGWIPTFETHQVINNREAESNLPSIEEADEEWFAESDTSTRESRVDHASGTREGRDDHANTGEGKGRGKEGKGREGKDPPAHQGDAPTEYPDDFEYLWGLRPIRAGGNPKRKAFQAYNARLKEGYTHDQMRDGLLRYAAFCRAMDKLQTEHVQQLASFFGPKNLGFLEDWTPPQSEAERKEESGQQAVAAFAQRGTE